MFFGFRKVNMPYPGVPESLTDRMDRCVTSVSARSDMSSKYPDSKERKSHAIAICHASIVGSKKIEDSINDLLKRKEVKKMTKEDILEDFEKVYENEGLEAFSDADFYKLAPDDADDVAKAKFSACMREQMKSGKGLKEAAKACQMPGGKDEDEDGEEDEAKAKKADGKSEEAEEEESKKVVKAKKAKKPDPDQAEEDQEEEDEGEDAKKAKAKEEDEDEDEAKAQKADVPSIIKVLTEAMKSGDVEKMKDALTKASEFLAQDYGALKPAKEETQEGVMPADKATKVESAKAAIGEAIAKLEELPGADPALAKLDSVLEKVGDIAKSVSGFDERLKKIEAQPADSKVSSTAVVVKKEGAVEETGRVDEINKELKKLEEVKTYDLTKYQNERMWEKAFDLIAERDALAKVE